MRNYILVSCAIISILIISTQGFTKINTQLSELWANNEQKLLLFLMDGFRWDYLDYFFPNLTGLPGFSRLINEGIRAAYLTPDFTSSSYPNYYSLMTGLHQENHGFVHNYMYDPKTGEEFLIGGNEDQYNSHWWEDAEPFWIGCERRGGQSVYMWYWCGCEVEIFGTRPSFCYPYQLSGRPTIEQFRTAINEAVQVMSNGTASVTAIYYEELDKIGHNDGPTSSELAEYIEYIDAELVNLFQQLDATNLTQSVNIMMFADHGMNLSPTEQGINVLEYINLSDYERQLGGGAVRQIWPYPGDEQRVYNLLKDAHPNMQVYLKEEIPEAWHYKNHPRVPPILLVADMGWRLDMGPGSLVARGVHGYEPVGTDMDGVFYANGPMFKRGYVAEGLHAVDLYQLMCHIVDLEPMLHNGTWSKVEDMLNVN